jgi:coronin-7
MAWRFKASKYKNAAPFGPKPMDVIRDLSLGSYRSHGNFISASAAFMAFNWDAVGAKVAVLPLDTKGRQNKDAVPLIFAHTDFVTDIQFSPFDDGLLATGSQDLTVKLWRIPEAGLGHGGLSQPELVLPSQPRRVETVAWHPTVDCILGSTSYDSLVIWDLIQAKELYNFQDHEDEVQSLAWQHSGQLLATQCKDRQLRILDPRQAKCVASCDSHQGIKDSDVVWINGPDQNRIFTSGFSSDRLRELTIRDLRNLNTPIKNLGLDNSAGLLVPLYDPDTNMCFLAGKGDRHVQFIELSDKEPFIIEGLRFTGEQTKGACLVPKRAMDVMQAEVNRVLQLGDSSVVPITWQVPRKSYREYHADIFPMTNGLESGPGPSTWWNGSNAGVPKINLDPSKRPQSVLTVFGGALSERDANKVSSENGHTGTASSTSPDTAQQQAKNGSNENNALPAASAQQQNSPASAASNGHQNPFAKPNPRPRCVVKANSVSSPAPASNKPQIAPRIVTNKLPQQQPIINRISSSDSFVTSSNNGTAGNGNVKNEDTIDEGLALLRRQPSIRDRKKLFEEQIQRQNSDVTENKENHIIKPTMEKDENQQHLRKNIFADADKPKTLSVEENKPAKRVSSKSFVRVSKFKHLKGDVMLKGKFENFKNLSKSVPAESNLIEVNEDRIAVPLSGPGGKLAIFETKRPGRIEAGVTPVLINGTTVLDFAFDPFDKTRLVAGCDDGIIRVWKIPEGGLTCQVNQADMELSVAPDKVQIVKWHPLAKDILCTVAFDKSVKIWDLNKTEDGPQLELQGHTEQLFSAEWSGCGRYLATCCKDGKIRVYEPTGKSGPHPISEGGEIVPKKGARIAWVLNGQYLIVTGFSKQSERLIMVFKLGPEPEMVHTLTLDVSPAVLIPFYDEDSGTLFLSSKGESTVTTFEVSLDSPHLFPLSPYRPSGLHQGLAFLPKNVVDVKNVEFARAYRLTNNTIEPISFTVPRIKTVYFQDDLFPNTKVLWEATLSAEEWMQGSQKQAPMVSLCPEGMLALSGSNNNNSSRPTSKQQDLASNFSTPAVDSVQIQASREMAKKAEEGLEQSVSNLVDISTKLEQDNMETGVDEKEWDDDE